MKWPMTPEEKKAAKKQKREERRAEAERVRRERAELAEQVQRERAEKLRRRAEAKERKKWAATDHGRARVAYDAGERFLQIQRVISETKANVMMMVGAFAVSDEVDHSAQSTMGMLDLRKKVEDLPITQALAVIEDIGWRLIHAGYAYRETYSESRDKFLASGQQIATSGEIVAVYLFRRADPLDREDSSHPSTAPPPADR